jgi:hypothetical protein
MSKQIVARCFLNQLIPLELDSVFPSPPTEGERTFDCDVEWNERIGVLFLFATRNQGI